MRMVTPMARLRVGRAGQTLVEYAVVFAAVAAALVMMWGYVREAFNAHANAVEAELNGAVLDNRPGGT